jgi:hypothetical protein
MQLKSITLFLGNYIYENNIDGTNNYWMVKCCFI